MHAELSAIVPNRSKSDEDQRQDRIEIEALRTSKNDRKSTIFDAKIDRKSSASLGVARDLQNDAKTAPKRAPRRSQNDARRPFRACRAPKSSRSWSMRGKSIEPGPIGPPRDAPGILGFRNHVKERTCLDWIQMRHCIICNFSLLQ